MTITVLDEIFTKAYLEKKSSWSKKWLKFANKLVPGVFDKNEKLNVSGKDFKAKLREISTAWINKYNFDQKFFNQLNKGVEND